MTDTLTAPPTPCTDEQMAEWNEMHDRMFELYRLLGEALQQAGDFLRHALENPADRKVVERLAYRSAQEAIRFRDERAALGAVVDAHPYTAELAAARSRLTKVDA